ncbi:MAG: hypothetical protein IJ752_00685 [Alphaproteobacteria bacterium]|nr:hypothetical protein [Alphaproteobacteria bacterium]
MLSKIKQNIIQIWRKLPWPILILFGLWGAYKWVFSVTFPLPRHQEWDTLPMFSKQGASFPETAAGWPVLPELITHLFYLFGGWHIRAYLVLNYMIYLADIFLLYRLIVKAAGPYRYLPLFFLPFFSDLNALNLMYTAALPIHLTILFGLLAADFGFQRLLTYHNSMRFILFLSLSVFSMNSVFALSIFVGWAVMGLMHKNWKGVLGAFLVFMVVLNLFIFMFSGSSFSDFGQSLKKAVISSSAVLTGFDVETQLHFVLILPILGTLGYVMYKNKLWRDRDSLTLYTVIVACFLSAVSLLSAPVQIPFSFINAAVGFVMFLVPVVLTLLRIVRPVFIYATCLALLGYSADFSDQPYQLENSIRLTMRQCAEEYFAGQQQPKACRILEDPHLPTVLDQARQLRLNFTR